MINQSILKKSGYIKYLAPAKLNLFLKIISKRSDGYHNLQSIFQNIEKKSEILSMLSLALKHLIILWPSYLQESFRDVVLKIKTLQN